MISGFAETCAAMETVASSVLVSDDARDEILDIYEEATDKDGLHLSDEELLHWFFENYQYCLNGTWRKRVLY